MRTHQINAPETFLEFNFTAALVGLQVQSELSMAYLQEFYSVSDRLNDLPCNCSDMCRTTSELIPALQTVRDKCFEKCVTKPSSSLGSSEQQCLARCCDRYAEVSMD